MNRRHGLLALCLLTGVPAAHAQAPPDFQVSRASTPPAIDGDLTDEAWLGKPLEMGSWVTYNPLRGETVPTRTEVRIVYDDRNIYFAFHCFDDEPDKIRTTVSRRDSVFNDDWIALSLDSAGTGQTAYHLFVNPSGVQMDALNTSSGERFEADMIWDTAGKVTDDGYVVELRLPLQTVRFSGGDAVRMGLVFFRRVSRSGVSASWPEMAPGQWVFDRPAHLVFENLKQPPLIELLPSVTYGVTQIRATADRWDDADRKSDFGMSGKYGITSNITLDATVNPDFSQVESDAFQVEVNQRFPVFFSEKRPFFMEGMGLFDLAGTGGDSNMRTAVHTRRIINPDWGSKVTGTVGQVTFGLLNSLDASPQDLDNRGEAISGRKKLFTLGRATYALGQSNYAGAIMIDTEHAGRHNRVIGGDLSFRFSPRHSISTMFLASDTGVRIEQRDGYRVAGVVPLRLAPVCLAESGRALRPGLPDGYRILQSYGLHVRMVVRRGEFLPERRQQLLAEARELLLFRQGGTRPRPGRRRTIPERRRPIQLHAARLPASHPEPRPRALGRPGIRNRRRHQHLRPWTGPQVAGYQRKLQQEPRHLLRPVGSLSGELGQPLVRRHASARPAFQPGYPVRRVWFDRASTGGRVFTVDIVNLRTTYQFNRHFLVRLIEQYDSSRQRLLTDLLGSYEFVPGTVLHAGYGSLLEKRDFSSSQDSSSQDGRLLPEGGDFTTVSRGLFFKASYVHRF